MPFSTSKLRIGAVQSEPVWNDLEGCVDKTCAIIKDAAGQGVNLLGFPEVWIPGYPGCIWRESVRQNSEYLCQYRRASMTRTGPEMARIKECARIHGVFVVLGYSERDGSTIYISNAWINSLGEMVHHRRKIKPTSVERALWGEGQADSLQVVHDTPFGRIGALNCWEHYQPLLRYVEYDQRVDIHVAAWPVLSNRDAGPAKGYHTTGEANMKLCQVMAMEGACFLMVATEIRTTDMEKTGGDKDDRAENTAIGPGFSMIFGPDGSPLCEPLRENEQGIVVADIDLADRLDVGGIIDVVGHYSRPDLLSVNRTVTPATHVHHI